MADDQQDEKVTLKRDTILEGIQPNEENSCSCLSCPVHIFEKLGNKKFFCRTGPAPASYGPHCSCPHCAVYTTHGTLLGGNTNFCDASTWPH